MRNAVVLLVSVLGAAACAPEANYVYRPAEQATATLAGRPAARYGIPPESPRGSLRLATCGVVGVQTAGVTVHTLHVRLVIANNNDEGPWDVDTGALRAVYASGDTLAPLFVNASVPADPDVQIAPGEAATIDAYFPLPSAAEAGKDVPHFDVLTTIRTPEREVVERTPFERIRYEPQIVSAHESWGLGPLPAGWNDPFLVPGAAVLAAPPAIVVAPVRP